MRVLNPKTEVELAPRRAVVFVELHQRTSPGTYGWTTLYAAPALPVISIWRQMGGGFALLSYGCRAERCSF